LRSRAPNPVAIRPLPAQVTCCALRRSCNEEGKMK
jgi:hypothetical protein